jgi:hypothetical protein
MDPCNPGSSLGRMIDTVSPMHLSIIIAYYFKNNRTMPPILPDTPDKYSNYYNWVIPFLESVTLNKLNAYFRRIDEEDFVEKSLQKVNDYLYIDNQLTNAEKFAIADIIHKMLNKHFIELDSLRADLNIGFAGLDAQQKRLDVFEGLFSNINLPDAKPERKLRISNDIQVLKFIDEGIKGNLERILFQIRYQSQGFKPK